MAKQKRERVWLLLKEGDIQKPGADKLIVLQRGYPKRKGWVVVDSHLASDPPPKGSDAREWDAWRTRNGYAPG